MITLHVSAEKWGKAVGSAAGEHRALGRHVAPSGSIYSEDRMVERMVRGALRKLGIQIEVSK